MACLCGNCKLTGESLVDCRDDQTWVVIELTRQGEMRVEEGVLEGMLRKDLSVDPDYPIFIPATTYEKSGRKITIHLLEGYVFAAAGLAETTYFDLEKRSYVSQVMSSIGTHEMRVLSVITNEEIRQMRRQLRGLVSADISVGERVRIMDGLYSTLEGEVIDRELDQAIVHLEFRSLNVLASVPLVFLEILS